MKNTFVYGASSVVLGTTLALAVAILMNQKVPGIGVFRTLYYLPAVTSGIATAIMFAWMFNPRAGLVNFLLSVLGIEGPSWFSSSAWAMPGLIIVGLWSIGPNMIILLAGLQGIPDQLYEAARIDGANRLQEFINITVPMLSPVLFYVAVITMIGSFQIFENVLVMTQGGPGSATRVIVYDLYQNAFVNSRMGYASAQAWILCIVIMLLTWMMFRFSKNRVNYETI
jgi:multiple sugar transport system permease protein